MVMGQSIDIKIYVMMIVLYNLYYILSLFRSWTMNNDTVIDKFMSLFLIFE